MNVTVVGAGKMGLPLASQFASRGANVIVCDVRQDVQDGECSQNGDPSHEQRQARRYQPAENQQEQYCDDGEGYQFCSLEVLSYLLVNCDVDSNIATRHDV